MVIVDDDTLIGGTMTQDVDLLLICTFCEEVDEKVNALVDTTPMASDNTATLLIIMNSYSLYRLRRRPTATS